MPSAAIASFPTSPKREAFIFRVFIQKTRIGEYGLESTAIAIAAAFYPALNQPTMHTH